MGQEEQKGEPMTVIGTRDIAVFIQIRHFMGFFYSQKKLERENIQNNTETATHRKTKQKA
jgi:hypothetical protein